MKRHVGPAIVALLWGHQVVLDASSPIAKDDWSIVLGDRWSWAARDLIHTALVDWPTLHMLLTPIVVVALLVAIVRLALDRWPDPRRLGDAAALALASTAIWIAAPRAGVSLTYRGAAAELYATCGAAWAIVSFRVVRGDRAKHHALAILAGVVLGSASRAVGPTLLVGLLASSAKQRVPRWAFTGAAGIVIGQLLVWAAPPAADLDLAWARIPNAYFRDVLVAMRGPIGIATATLAVAIIQRMRGRSAGDAIIELARLVPAALGAAILVTAIIELDPRPDTLQLVGPAAALAVPLIRAAWELAADPLLRAVAVGGATLAQVNFAWVSIHELRVAHRDATNRAAVLEAVSPGDAAIVPLSRRMRPTPYVVGEDLLQAAVRNRVGTRVYGARRIDLVPAPKDMEPTPALDLGLARQGSASAEGPRWFSADLATAREQLATTLPDFRSRGVRDLTLQTRNVRAPDRDEPLAVAWMTDGGELESLTLTPHGAAPLGIDARGRIRLVGDEAAIKAATWWAVSVNGDRPSRRLAVEEGAVYVDNDHETTYAVAGCSPARCALAAVVIFE